MSLSITTSYVKSQYQIDLESSINTNLSSISSNQTTYATAIATLSGNITTLSSNITTLSSNITTLSGNITTLSGNVTALNDFISVTVSTAVFTLDLTTYRNFTVTNTETSGKTLKIANAPTASDTMLNLSVKLTFSATATFTYTGTITWSTTYNTAMSTAPSPSAVGTFLLNLKSFDAGVNWLASYTGLY